MPHALTTLTLLLILGVECSVYPTKGASVDVVDLFWSAAGTSLDLQPPSVAKTMSIEDPSTRWTPGSKDGAHNSAPNGTHTKHAIQTAASHGFKFFRFGATLFWPNQQKLWTTDPARYWGYLDEVFQYAEQSNCSLIPSILWNHFCLADLAGEPLGQLFVEGSKVRNLVKKYVVELRERYSHRPALLAWELGNEMNLLADLDLQKQQPAIAPQMGTPKQRTKADNFSSSDMIQFQQDMAGWLRVPHRTHQIPISSGNSVPRAAAHHLRESYHAKERDFTPDTQQQYATYLKDIHNGLDLVSVHMYPGKGMDRFGKGWGQQSTGLLNYTQQVVESSMPEKGLYLGEYGGHRPSFTFGYEVLYSLIGQKILMSTMWVWEFGPQNSTWSLWPNNAVDKPIIAHLQAANKAVRNL